MKPNINTDSLLFKAAFMAATINSEIALNVEQTVEKAVIPIYHKPEEKRIQQIGSGVLVRIKNEYFVFTASHVLDQIGKYVLLTSDGHSTLQMLPGERFSTPRDEYDKHICDPLDASVYHISAPLCSLLKDKAISLNDFDPSPIHGVGGMFLSAGFRIKNTNYSKGVLSSKGEAFPSVEISSEDYQKANLDPAYKIALAHEQQYYTGRQWQNTPIPRGFSGGAIIRIVSTPGRKGIEYRQVLSGIITEHIKKNQKHDGILAGTRLVVHIEALKKFMPELFQ